MVCQVCHRLSRGSVCGDCRRQLRPGRDRILPGGLRLVSAFEHEGPARALMHDLKYRGITQYASLVGEALRDRLPDLPVVPVPRSLSRRLRYGVDPAVVIASRLGRPVLHLLSPPVHSRRRAGGDHARPAPGFRVRTSYTGRVIVVDDVVTSGKTLRAAVEALGGGRVSLAVSGNVAGQISARARRPRVKASS